MKKRNYISRLAAAAAGTVMIIALVSVPASAGQKNLAVGSGGEQGVQLPMHKVSIAKKTLESVISNSGDRYALSDETIITGLDGQQVNIRKMLVPCEAEITYETKNGLRTAQRIKIVSIARDASRKWVSDRPD
jgi:hypothetical protein